MRSDMNANDIARAVKVLRGAATLVIDEVTFYPTDECASLTRVADALASGSHSNDRRALLLLHYMMRQHSLDQFDREPELTGCYEIVCAAIDGQPISDTPAPPGADGALAGMGWATSTELHRDVIVWNGRYRGEAWYDYFRSMWIWMNDVPVNPQPTHFMSLPAPPESDDAE